MQYTGQAAGFLVFAPVLYYFGGAEAALGGSFVLMVVHSAMANVLAARLRTMARSVRDAGPGRFAGLRQTVAFFRRSAPARDALAVNAVKALVTQVILVAFPLYLKQDLSLGNQGALLLLAPGIAGAALGLAWAATGLSLEGTARAMRLSIAGLTVAVLALASLDYGVSAAFVYSQVPPLVHFEAGLNLAAIVGMPVAFLIGASLSVAVVSSRAALTAAAPVAIQSRAFAVQSTASDALMVLPLLFAGVLAEVLGARMTLAALGAVSGVAWLMVWHPRFQLRLFVRSAESGV
jgi:hypothetical protein